MKLFVAGATGVLGHRAVDRLIVAGHEVTGLARSDAKVHQLEDQGARSARVDLFDPAALGRAVEGHDGVLNLATHIPRASRALTPGAWKTNDRIRAEGSANLVDAALAAGAEVFVQESISFTYPDSGDRWIDESVEITPPPAVRTVLDAQQNLERFTAGGGRGVLLRFGMLYSADSHQTIDLFGWARRGFSLELGPPEAYKTMVHADDAAAAAVAVLDAPAGIYNVGEVEPLTRGEHVALVARLVGRDRLRPWADRLARLAAAKSEFLMRSQRVSSEKLRSATGWRPRFGSVREGYPAVLAAIDSEDVTRV